MGFWSGARKLAGTIVDVRVDRWMSYDLLKNTSQNTYRIAEDLIRTKQATYLETFEEAMARQGLTEEDINARKKEFTRLTYTYVTLALILLGYCGYMIFEKSLFGSSISFLLVLYCLTQAFRFHFWLFQLRERKLGCTFQEWLNSTVHH